jgi:hypothetical protein
VGTALPKKIMRPKNWSMIRQSGNRFAEKVMRPKN